MALIELDRYFGPKVRLSISEGTQGLVASVLHNHIDYVNAAIIREGYKHSMMTDYHETKPSYIATFSYNKVEMGKPDKLYHAAAALGCQNTPNIEMIAEGELLIAPDPLDLLRNIKIVELYAFDHEKRTVTYSVSDGKGTYNSMPASAWGIINAFDMQDEEETDFIQVSHAHMDILEDLVERECRLFDILGLEKINVPCKPEPKNRLHIK